MKPKLLAVYINDFNCVIKKVKEITEMNIGNGLLLKYVIPNKE